MQNFLEKVKVDKPRKSNFDLSHNVLLTTDFGKLTPFMGIEVVPGDSFDIRSELFARVAPMLAPVFSQIDIYTHYFFVPMRLVFDQWEDFITGGKDGTKFPHLPQFVGNNSLIPESLQSYFQKGSLWDYFGLPTIKDSAHSEVLKNIKVNFQIFQAYNLIYNEYYRDQNVTNEVDFGFNYHDDVDITKAANNWLLANLLGMKYRCYGKDYFTAALPWAQRGAEVHLPIYGDASLEFTNGSTPSIIRKTSSHNYQTNETLSPSVDIIGSQVDLGLSDASGTPTTKVALDNSANLKVDMNSVLGATINEWRNSFSLQKFLEKNARSGGRYAEQLRAHFGVTPSDARLQRPEYLGGGVQPVQIGEVVQTSESTNSSDLGELAGRGIAGGFTNRFKRYFDEHGFIIGIMSILPKSTYYQGINRMFSRRDRYDYYFPEFANLGEQEVLNKELYQSGNNAVDNETFGYVPRYAEYKYLTDRVSGDFRDSLEYWHLGRKFGNTPVLGNQFLQCIPKDNDRIFAVQSSDSMYTDHFWITIHNKVHAKRPMPYFGTPSF